MTAVFAIALGAFIGAPMRALIEQTLGRVRSPLETLLLINSLGSLLAGFSIGAFTGDLRLFLVMGAAGAFTTFSGWALAMSNYSERLTDSGSVFINRLTKLAIVILVGIAIPVLAAWVGFFVSELLF